MKRMGVFVVILSFFLPLMGADYPAPVLKRKMPDTIAIAGTIFSFTAETVHPFMDATLGQIYVFKELDGPEGYQFPSGVNTAFWEVPADAKDDTLIYQAADIEGRAAKDTFIVKIDHAPTLTKPFPAETTIIVGQKLSLPIKASDPDGDKVSYELIVQLGDMAVSADGIITYTPTIQDTGSSRIRFYIKDPLGAQTKVSFDVVVKTSLAMYHSFQAPGRAAGGFVFSADGRTAIFNIAGGGIKDVKIDLYDLKGSLVKTVVDGSYNAGSYAVPVTGLPRGGMYTAEMTIDGQKCVKGTVQTLR